VSPVCYTCAVVRHVGGGGEPGVMATVRHSDVLQLARWSTTPLPTPSIPVSHSKVILWATCVAWGVSKEGLESKNQNICIPAYRKVFFVVCGPAGVGGRVWRTKRLGHLAPTPIATPCVLRAVSRPYVEGDRGATKPVRAMVAIFEVQHRQSDTGVIVPAVFSARSLRGVTCCTKPTRPTPKRLSLATNKTANTQRGEHPIFT